MAKLVNKLPHLSVQPPSFASNFYATILPTTRSFTPTTDDGCHLQFSRTNRTKLSFTRPAEKKPTLSPQQIGLISRLTTPTGHGGSTTNNRPAQVSEIVTLGTMRFFKKPTAMASLDGRDSEVVPTGVASGKFMCISTSSFYFFLSARMFDVIREKPPLNMGNTYLAWLPFIRWGFQIRGWSMEFLLKAAKLSQKATCFSSL